jgi:hypothetical protein
MQYSMMSSSGSDAPLSLLSHALAACLLLHLCDVLLFFREFTPNTVQHCPSFEEKASAVQPSGGRPASRQAIGHVGSLKLRACWYSLTTSHPPKSDKCNFSCGLAGTWSLCQRKGRTGTASQPPHHRSSGDSRGLLGPLLLSHTSPARTRRGRLAGSCVSRTRCTLLHHYSLIASFLFSCFLLKTMLYTSICILLSRSLVAILGI